MEDSDLSYLTFDEMYFDPAKNDLAIKAWAKLTMDVGQATLRMKELNDVTYRTMESFIEYVEADVASAHMLVDYMERYAWMRYHPGLIRGDVAVVAKRNDGRRLLGTWLDEWAQWEFDVYGDTVVFNGIKMPRHIPMTKEIELPKFDIRESKEFEPGMRRLVRTFWADEAEPLPPGLVKLFSSMKETVYRFQTEDDLVASNPSWKQEYESTWIHEPPVTKQRRRREVQQNGGNRFGLHNTVRSGRRSRS